MNKEIPYNHLPLLAYPIAEAVCETPFESEFSDRGTSSEEVARVEALRQKMTRSQIGGFARRIDDHCREAYRVKAPWFMKCVRSKTNAGRDQLYAWVRHWLHAYLLPPRKRR